MVDRIAVLGLLAGMAALWAWNWGLIRIVNRHERQIKELQARKQYAEENRCHVCMEQDTCEAANTGVIYPCPYFIRER